MRLKWRNFSSLRVLVALPLAALVGCLAARMHSKQAQGTDSSSARFDPAQRLSPTAFEQNVSMKNTSVHEDPSLLKVGESRTKIIAAFGTPNQISDQGGQEREPLRVQSGRFKIRQAENLCA
jgi:hypothetical protein